MLLETKVNSAMRRDGYVARGFIERDGDFLEIGRWMAGQ
jgi:hypothetical protein